MRKITPALLLALLFGFPTLAAPRLKAGDRIVTLGDSITQAGGYQELMQKVLTRFYPDLSVEIVNAGIGGHKAPDMAARLQKDVIDKKPTIVTVSCGVNDVWHGFYSPPRGVDLETYSRLMTQMVQQLKTNTSAAIYLLTPTIIHENLRGPENLKLEAYCQAVREIARREGVHLVDLNKDFNFALRSAQIGGAAEFHPTSDGVHMKPAGNFLIAAAILQALEVPITQILEVSAAVNAYPVKYLDIIHRHRILHGSNPFEGLSFSRDACVFRLKQVLLNLRLRLRSLYVLRGLNEEQLVLVVADAVGPLRSCAATILELEGHAAPSPREALEQILPAEDSAWHDVINHLSQARQTRTLEAGVAGKTLFRVMELTEFLLSRVGNLPKEP